MWLKYPAKHRDSPAQVKKSCLLKYRLLCVPRFSLQRLLHCLDNMASFSSASPVPGNTDYDYSFLIASDNGLGDPLDLAPLSTSEELLAYGQTTGAASGTQWPSSGSEFTDITQAPQWNDLLTVPDWPDGRQKVTVKWDVAKRSESSKVKPWHANGWAWEWYGCHWVEKVKGKVTMKKCLGVFNCPDPGRTGCLYVLRPLTKGKLKTQLLETCPMCHVILQYTVCGLRACIIDSKEQQTETWLHFGTHYHDKPTWGRQINRRIHAELTNLVLSNAEATPSQLQRSQSINTAGVKKNALDICPKFTNRSSLRHYKDTILTTANVISRTAKNTDTFIKQLKSAQKDFPNWILHSSFNDHAEIIVMQSEFMASCMDQMTIATNNQSGYITDAAHGFFEHGLLLNTVGFMPVMGRWMPVLISWIGSNTADCYEIHFSHFIKSMRKQVPVLTDDHLSNVVDFSEAESKGFKQAFISNAQEAMLEEILSNSTNVNGQTGTEQRQSMSEQFCTVALEQRAAACLKGCRFHFEKNLVKVKRNSNFVPVEEAERFAYLVESLLDCDNDVYETTVRIIRETFPKTDNWLAWWTDTRVAEKLFECKRAMSATRAAQIPSTTNAVESVHRQIYLACQARPGQRFNVIQGIHALKMHDQTNQTLSENCNMGYKLNYGSIQRSWTMIEQYGTSRPRGQKTSAEHFNDGRPIDNTKKLLKSQNLAAKADLLAGSIMVDGIRYFPKSHCYQSTPWQDNLCYFDSLVEVFYSSYMRDQCYWDKLAQTTQDLELDNPKLAPLTCFLSLMKARFTNYLEAKSVSGLQASLISSRNNSLAGFSMASIIQYGELGSSGEVWHHTVSASSFDPKNLSPFHAYSISFVLCRAGHNTHPLIHPRCEFVLPSISKESPDLRKMADDHILQLLGNGFDVRHLEHCSEKDCKEMAFNIKLTIRLPRVFLVEEQSAAKTKQAARYVFPERLLVPCQQEERTKKKHRRMSYSSATTCHFSMSGKILYQANSQHYTALVRGYTRPTVHLFDGMKKNPNPVLCAVEQGMGYCEPVNTGRNSLKSANEILCRTSSQTASVLYNLDDHDKAQHQFHLAAVARLDAIGIRLVFSHGVGYSLENYLSLQHQLAKDWSTVPDMNNTEQLQFKQRLDLFDRPALYGKKLSVLDVPTGLSVSANPSIASSRNSPQVPTLADTAVKLDLMKDVRLPERPAERMESKPKRSKPSYEYITEPVTKLAPKEFQPDINLPPRAARLRMQQKT